MPQCKPWWHGKLDKLGFINSLSTYPHNMKMRSLTFQISTWGKAQQNQLGQLVYRGLQFFRGQRCSQPVGWGNTRERVAGRRKLGLLRPRPSALAKAAAAAKAKEGTGRVDCRKQFGGSAFLAKNQRSLLFSSSSRQGQTTLTFRAREAAAPTAAALQGCCCKDRRMDEG